MYCTEYYIYICNYDIYDTRTDDCIVYMHMYVFVDNRYITYMRVSVGHHQPDEDLLLE